jgi:hypothetical protein
MSRVELVLSLLLGMMVMTCLSFTAYLILLTTSTTSVLTNHTEVQYSLL